MFPPGFPHSNRKPAEVETLRMAATRYGGTRGRIVYLAWHLVGEVRMVGILKFSQLIVQSWTPSTVKKPTRWDPPDVAPVTRKLRQRQHPGAPRMDLHEVIIFNTDYASDRSWVKLILVYLGIIWYNEVDI
jgi:hypothetical protein